MAEVILGVITPPIDPDAERTAINTQAVRKERDAEDVANFLSLSSFTRSEEISGMARRVNRVIALKSPEI
jgi:hypothetical protein